VPERDLGRLLASVNPVLQPGTYVYCTLGPGERPDTPPLLQFEEPEGTTVVVLAEDAQRRGWTAVFPCQWIVLGATSDLEAVGFLAAVVTELARAGIAANAVSAFHHDHLFVPAGRVGEALEVVGALQRQHRAAAGRPDG